ncbi:ATP-binding cassette domain-containing protein [Actinokineospora xionganensis]|uniref:ATP-binding cassette domain-containing protein n=1 Tax=Actinokineospora xionganensis TaxID=2684470 RepID=A0ABR7KZU7_9PSEU|nr:ATP-binding cassette domain-containing protein [Actinokineospora xionganensis]MBC6445945.1 ATP-binding cassette domain-containing protein [Actinokineospora xionganensis]
MITVKGVYKYVRLGAERTTALRDLTLEVPEGGITGVLGPPGSGKSTLARLVALRDTPDAGVISVDGVNTMSLDRPRMRSVRRDIAMTDVRALFAGRSAAGNIASPMERAFFDPPRIKAEVAKLLDLTGLTGAAGCQPGDLAPGERRRLALAQALAAGPRLVVADDSGEGVHADSDLVVALDRARSELGVTVLMLTSDVGMAGRVDTVALLRDGHIGESGTLWDLIQRPDSLVARALLPEIAGPRIGEGVFDIVAEAVLPGFSAIGSLMPAAAIRFDVDIQIVGGGITKVGETPVARFLLGIDGPSAADALDWISTHCSVVRDRRTFIPAPALSPEIVAAHTHNSASARAAGK